MGTAARVIAVTLALLVILAAVLGPIGLDVVRFHVSDNARAQYVGGEVATLVAAGVLLLAAALPHGWISLLVPGSCVYLIYTFVTVVMGQAWPASPPGSAGAAFPLYAAITALATTLTVVSLVSSRPAAAPSSTVPTQVLLVAVGVLFAALWALQVAALYRGGPSPEYLDDPGLFWLIKFLDYGFVIPALLLIAVGLAQAHPAALAGAPVVVTFAALLAAAIAGMGVSLAISGQGAGAWVMAGVMSLLCLVSVAALVPWVAARASL